MINTSTANHPHGIATVNVYAGDVAAARDWYAEVFGIEAYFAREAGDRLGYAEFRVGAFGHEFGIIDAQFAPPGAADGPAGALVHWHVDDVSATVERLLTLGATPYLPITDRGDGFVTASVVDPFGNLLGVMRNPHFVEQVARVER